MADEKDPLEEMQHTPLLVLPDKVHKQLTAWLRAYIPTLRMNRDKNDNIKDRIATWHSTLRGVRRVPPFRRGVSNLSTPLTLWASAAIRARIRQAVLESKPVLAALPLKSASDSGVDLNRLATAYSRVFQAEFDSPNGLDGATAVEKAINEVVNLGTAGIKVYEEITPPCYVLDANGVPTLVPSKSRVKWDFIAFQDLIYVDGYGDDTQAMPLCGHEYDITWGEMEIWRAAKQFYPNVLDRVKAHYNPGHTTMASLPYDDMPAKLKTHRVAELHLRYCIDDPDARDYTGYPTALVLTWHVEAGELLRCVRSPIPGGIKPIFLARLDDEPDPTKARGQGVCEKLEGAQEETDVIHNLGIEAAKRATAHAVMIKEGSNAAKEFGDAGMSVNPGDVAVTEDPKEDLVLKPLGDPRGSEVALMQEGNTKQYVFRILGLDEGSFGQVETGKRVPASLGISIQREGRTLVINSIKSFAKTLKQGAYLTGDLWKRRPPIESIAAVLPLDEAMLMADMVFTPSETTTRQQFVLTINAQDAASAMESRKQELLMINQFLMGYTDKLLQYAMMALQLPPPLQSALMSVLQKVENGVKAMLNTIDSIANPADVLPQVAELERALAEVAPMMQQAQQQQMMMQAMGGGGGEQNAA